MDRGFGGSDPGIIIKPSATVSVKPNMLRVGRAHSFMRWGGANCQPSPLLP